MERCLGEKVLNPLSAAADDADSHQDAVSEPHPKLCGDRAMSCKTHK
jgi:hypothetical protein